MESHQVRNLKIAMIVASLVCMVFLLLAAFEENISPGWRIFQESYARRLSEKNSDSKSPTVDYSIEIRQIYLAELNRVDRCVTCHVGIDNPNFKEEPLPLRSHPGDLLIHHPSDKFGCTICHQGQGRATSQEAAHGRAPHWPEPMLKGKLVYTSCGRCHYENDLYGGQSDLYGQVTPIKSIGRGELSSSLPGAENIVQGKKAVIEHGCLGCHQYRGRGGSLGPEITYVGDKTVHDFDFHHVPGERTVENWMFSHFKSPTAVVPNTLMPEMNLSDQEARDLAAYMISLKRKSAPAGYTPLPQIVDMTPVRGETLYKAYCSSCHGVDGVGAIVRDALATEISDRPRQLITPSLRNEDTLAVASDDFLRYIIAHGRAGTSMPAWQSDGGLTEDEIELLVGYIRSWEPLAADSSMISASRGNLRYGAALFRANCAACHGNQGEGGPIGVSLRSANFLSIASKEMLVETILHGRPNTAMPAWKQFDNREISDLLALIKSWLPLRSDRDEVLAKLASIREKPSPESVAIGWKLYRSRCEVCHGAEGQGKIGPSLNNQSVLTIVSNEFLHDTIVLGRPGTAMPAWRQLSSEDVVDLIALMRSWQTDPPQELPRQHASGDWQNGAVLFQGMCASCHGSQAEGAIGPQLVNSVFLKTTSDAMLNHWISYGRTGTQMRPFLQGQQGIVELSEHQIEDIITFLRHQTGRRKSDGQRIGIGFALRGEVLYRSMCSSCHGTHGEGANGPAIRNPTFLAAATDGFLRATIVLGRDGTEMRSMGHRGSGIVELEADQIDDLIAFLRSVEPQNPQAPRFVMGAHPDQGEKLYQGLCSGCHGTDGRGEFAPELNNLTFLQAATDGYLQATIIRGRRGTAMRPFGMGRQGMADLTQDQVNNIVAYIRQWSPDTRPLKRTEPFPVMTNVLDDSTSPIVLPAGTASGAG